MSHHRPQPSAFPAPERARSRRAPVGPSLPPRSSRGELSLSDLAWALARGRWTVLAVAAAVVAAAGLYLILATPLYRASALLQIEERSKAAPGLEDLSALLGGKTPAEAEIEILRSRSLLGSVVDQLALDVEARPRFLPLVGRTIARLHRGPHPAAALPGLGRYAFGGERIAVERLAVPEELEEEWLVLTALGEGRYRLAVDGATVVPDGQVGALVRSAGGGLAVELLVTELRARPGSELLLRKVPRSRAVQDLQEELQIVERGKRTGVVSITLDGPDPDRAARTVDAIAAAYLRTKAEQRTADASATLGFVESQLPPLKAKLDEAEAALSAFRRSRGTFDVARQTQAMLDRTVELERGLSELELQRSELRQRFTGDHPMLASVAQKAERLRSERAALQDRLQSLPEKEVTSARLIRDAKVASELYSLLLGKAQELRVIQSGSMGNVRIVDHAMRPDRPSSPKRGAVLSIALVLGLCGGVGTVLARRALDESASDPREIEAATGIPVHVTVPHSRSQASLVRSARRHPGTRPPILAQADPGDPAVESIRALRTSVELALAGTPRKVIAIGSSGPAVGKSFVCLNLACVLAAAGRRVVLVDGDLRRGQLHRCFGLDREPGVAEVLAGAATVQAALRPTGLENLSLLAAGSPPPNPAEVLSAARLPGVVEELARSYDVVLVDTPPALAVTDSALLARHADLNLLVLRAGRHPMDEIALTVESYGRAGVRIDGAVLNGTHFLGGREGRYGRYHRYEYRSVPRA